MPTLNLIILACTAGGFLSLAISALFAFRIREKSLSLLIAFSAGVLLATTFFNLLPEAIELAPEKAHELFAIVLLGILFFFLLQKFSIWRHSHDKNDHHGHDRAIVLTVIIGDAFHNFVDGILIAASFLADPWLGLVTTAAVISHEIPQELGDFIILLNSGLSKTKAFLLNSFSSLAAIIGGIVGYFALEKSQFLIPYILMLSASSFLYIALTDLFPMLQVRHHKYGNIRQVSYLSIGLVLTFTVSIFLHQH